MLSEILSITCMEVHKSINFLKANAYVMLSRLPENLLFSLRVLFLISDFNFVTCTSFCNDAMPTDCLIHSCCLMFRYLTFLAVLHQPVQWLVQSLEWTCVRLTMELFCFFNCLHVWTCVSECVWMDLNFIGSLVSECVWMDLNFIGSMVSEWFLNVFLNVNRLSPAGQTILVGRVKRKI